MAPRRTPHCRPAETLVHTAESDARGRNRQSAARNPKGERIAVASSISPGQDPDVRVRRAQVEDAYGIGVVHVRSWQAAYCGLVRQDFLDSLDPARRADGWQRLLRNVSEPWQETLVAEDGDVVVGFAHLALSPDNDDADDVGHVVAIYLLAEFWGHGHGRALMSANVAALREAGFVQATLWVLEENWRGRRFYESARWAPDGATKEDRGTGVAVNEVRYRRSLS
jgi:GNAT superfamily N-acetyltransferase